MSALSAALEELILAAAVSGREEITRRSGLFLTLFLAAALCAAAGVVFGLLARGPYIENH
jgi:hypothetical protein